MAVVARVLLVAAAVIGFAATPVAADAPGPTDYLSEVIAIEPATDAVAIRIIGGDSFFELTAAKGHVVDVIGYRGEFYLRFEADGTVLENQRSPSKYLNEERFGTDSGPVDVDPTAEPVWLEVASDGTFAWHDHRTHWMNEQKPVGAEAGDIILEQVVPLFVDGEAVDVTVISSLQEPPSATGVILGGVLAAGASLALYRNLLPGSSTLWLAVAAAVALVFGLWAFFSVPGETGPSLLLWAAPLLALGSAVVGYVKRSELLGIGLLMLGGVELMVWGWFRRGVLSASIIPSNAPDLFDRASVSLALVGGLIACITGAIGVGRVLTHGAPAPRNHSS